VIQNFSYLSIFFPKDLWHLFLRSGKTIHFLEMGDTFPKEKIFTTISFLFISSKEAFGHYFSLIENNHLFISILFQKLSVILGGEKANIQVNLDTRIQYFNQ